MKKRRIRRQCEDRAVPGEQVLNVHGWPHRPGVLVPPNQAHPTHATQVSLREGAGSRELVRRVPKTLERFSADVLIVTALPDLYFDEDVRDREARASFEHALEGLRNVAPLSLSIAVFSDATSFKTKRRDFFQRLRTQADHVVKVESTPENKLSFTREKNTPLLPA